MVHRPPAALAVKSGLWSWANPLREHRFGSAGGQSGTDFSRYKRETIIRVCSAQLAAVVLTPAILVYPIRRLQLEDTTRAMLYLGILVITLC
jgi:hypothetical protein